MKRLSKFYKTYILALKSDHSITSHALSKLGAKKAQKHKAFGFVDFWPVV